MAETGPNNGGHLDERSEDRSKEEDEGARAAEGGQPLSAPAARLGVVGYGSSHWIRNVQGERNSGGTVDLSR